MNIIKTWYGINILSDFGIPTFSSQISPYNVLNLAFLHTTGPKDVALLWAQLTSYLGGSALQTAFPENQTLSYVQQKIMDLYHSKNIKVIVSLFGDAENPTTAGKDPVKVGTDAANFVIQNHLDGVDVDWEDGFGFSGSNMNGEQWLIQLTQTLRSKLPSPRYIITHAPQAPYFMSPTSLYPRGAYRTVHQQVGNLIDWYNIQFYNQASTGYDTYQCIFVQANGWATGTAIDEMVTSGVSREKIVIGKPATKSDLSNTGYVLPMDLKNWCLQYNKAFRGFFSWQYLSDKNTGFQFYNNVSQCLGTQSGTNGLSTGTVQQPSSSGATIKISSSSTGTVQPPSSSTGTIGSTTILTNTCKNTANIAVNPSTYTCGTNSITCNTTTVGEIVYKCGYITWYGFDDNDDGSGNYGVSVISDPCIHQYATEDLGTYNNPITFAADINYRDFKRCDKIYVPQFRKYFILEDTCRSCTTERNSGLVHADLYMGESFLQGQPLINCEYAHTSGIRNAVFIKNPRPDYPVYNQKLFYNGICNVQEFTVPI
jgi:chitinase